MRIKSCIIYDHGDPSVGIQGGQWEINFGPSGIEIDDDQLQEFRDTLSETYMWDGGERGIVEFDFETDKRLAGEQAENEERDRLSDLAEMARADRAANELFAEWIR